MSLGIEYDMVLLPPVPLERPSTRPHPSHCRRQRQNNRNRATRGASCPSEAPRLTDDANSLSRDLSNISVTPGEPPIAPTPSMSTLRVPLLRHGKCQLPTPLGRMCQPHQTSHSWVRRSHSPLGKTCQGLGENCQCSTPSPSSQASTSAPSPDCMPIFPSPWDIWTLGRKSVQAFAWTSLGCKILSPCCNSCLHATSYSPTVQRAITPTTGGTTQPGNASTSTTRTLTKEINLECPGKVTNHSHAFGKRGSQAEPRPLLGATWLTSNNFVSCMPNSGRNNNGYNSCNRRWRRKPPTRPSMGACAQRHVMYNAALWKTPMPTHPRPSTGPAKAFLRQRSCSVPCRSPQPSKDAVSTTSFGNSWSALLSSRQRVQPLGFGRSPRITKWNPLASNERTRSIPHPPGRGHPRYETASWTTASPKGSTTASAGVFDTTTNNTRRADTTLGKVAAMIAGRIEALLLSHRAHRSSAEPSAWCRSLLGSGPRLPSPSIQGRPSQNFGSPTTN
jgi:hypothetical protein